MPKRRPRPTPTTPDSAPAATRDLRGLIDTAPGRERAYLVGLDHGQNGPMTAEGSLNELARLARTAGALVVGRTLQRRDHPEPATYIGKGKLEEVKAAKGDTHYGVVIFDEQLAPAQQLRLESALGVKVLDRSALILDIFASRARTREASLQVELAQHEYLMPRLRGQWQHLDRMAGAIGSRGPGETQLETDRRLIGARISRLKRDIDHVRRQRALHRRRRERAGAPVVALVGYTNAGKSSLMRALAGADVLVADALFATLDPITRRIGVPGSDAAFLLTDTVGFIQKLPTQLVSAFKATLEELESADLLIHVVDATSPDAAAQAESVLQTLQDLGLSEAPLLTVLNKIDGLTREDGTTVETEAEARAIELPDLIAAGLDTVLTSALRGWGIDALRARIGEEVLDSQPVTVMYS